MIRFNRSQRKELTRYLYSSYVHDARVDDIVFNPNNSQLNIRIENPFYKSVYCFSFLNVKAVLFANNHHFSGSDTINSITIEDDSTLSASSVRIVDDQCEQYLYLLLQMISGDEIHIMCGELFIEEERTADE